MFDKNLDLVTNFKIMSSYYETWSVWNPEKKPDPNGEITVAVAGSTNESKVYIPEIHQASDDFAIFINKMK